MNILNFVSPSDASWSSVNLAEAVPGVMTPLTSSVWVPASEMGLRQPFREMGVLPPSQAVIPADPADRITGAFFGRMAVRVDFLCEMGDLVPGQSGESLSRDFFGFVPPDFVSHPSNRRLPAIALRYPRSLATIARRIERDRREVDAWWRRSLASLGQLSADGARGLLIDARTRFTDALALQAVVSACAIQPVQDQISSLADSAGVDLTDLLRGHGSHEESVVLTDMWAVSRRELDMEEFMSRHGYHCAGEGEVSSVSWREDPGHVQRMVARFGSLPETESPRARAAELEQRGASATEKLRTNSSAGRIRVDLTLRLARRFIPLRGVGKVTYLQTLDVLRACARRLGADAAESGSLSDPEDAFYFTADELARPLPSGAGDIVSERRAQRADYESLILPPTWTGNPVPERMSPPDAPAAAAHTEVCLNGVGASPGTVTGRAVVVTDPATTDVDDGDILIAHTTDPSWVSLMFLSSALVVDIGGMMSHAAVVARELGIPCVMNTGNGTRVITTGDTVSVDGVGGTVHIVSTSAA